uniref:hypothetical protein n=1 Tax=Pseudomonas fluorescens TaxID=294 RepID=UPI001780B340|nr:hypothetical protein [Pseudomonas fluorescens]
MDIQQSGLSFLGTPVSADVSYNLWPTMVEAARIAAHACASTAWIMGVVGCHRTIINRLPEPRQCQIYGTNASQIFASASPTQDCSMTWTSEGVWVEGRWSFSSGVEDSSWLLINAECQYHPRTIAGQKFMAVVPTAEVNILPVWDSLGMRGTGSHDVIVQKRLVPHEQLYSIENLFSSRASKKINDYLEHMELYPYVTSAIIGPIFGCTEASFSHYLESLSTQTKLTQSDSIKSMAAKLNSLGLLYQSLLTRLDAAGTQGMSWSPIELSRLRRDRSFLARSCSEFVYQIITSLTSSYFSMQHPLQRTWRDLQTMVSHRDVSWAEAVKRQHSALD